MIKIYSKGDKKTIQKGEKFKEASGIYLIRLNGKIIVSPLPSEYLVDKLISITFLSDGKRIYDAQEGALVPLVAEGPLEIIQMEEK